MKKRKIFDKIKNELDNPLILLLIWARQVGKTTLLKQLRDTISSTRKTYFINLEAPDIRKLLDIHPNRIFEVTGATSDQPHIIFIDEIQYLHDPTTFLKYLYDAYKDTIKLVVSGSSSFYIDQKFRDSLIGRKRVFPVYTLDFREFLDFQDEIEIWDIIATWRPIPLLYVSRLESLILEYITYGGYPEVVLSRDHESKIDRLADYSLDYIKKDIYEANIADSDKFLSILRVLAHQSGELLNMSEIANTFNLSLPTVEKYIYIMQKSYHIALVRPYYTNIRKELSKMPKVYFYDLGFRNSLLRDFESIQLRMRDKWSYLENIVFREFLFRHGIENIRYWRTQARHEVDFIIDESHAYEVKFSRSLIRESKYAAFREQYPGIDLHYITWEHIRALVSWWAVGE